MTPGYAPSSSARGGAAGTRATTATRPCNQLHDDLCMPIKRLRKCSAESCVICVTASLAFGINDLAVTHREGAASLAHCFAPVAAITIMSVVSTQSDARLSVRDIGTSRGRADGPAELARSCSQHPPMHRLHNDFCLPIEGQRSSLAARQRRLTTSSWRKHRANPQSLREGIDSRKGLSRQGISRAVASAKRPSNRESEQGFQKYYQGLTCIRSGNLSHVNREGATRCREGRTWDPR